MELILAIDQSTQSTKIIFFDTNLKPVHMGQAFHDQKCEKPGWYEHDPNEILEQLYKLMNDGIKAVKEKHPDAVLKCIGITNQRETVVVWNKATGKPLYNAIVWLDTRTEDLVKEFSEKYNNDEFQKLTGTFINSYFSAVKVLWMMQNDDNIKKQILSGEALIGNINTWLIYNLTKGNHYTDVTNASRTMLMNITTLEWDKKLCKMFGMTNMNILPQIKSNCGDFGVVKNELVPDFLNVPITGCAGDQQSACIGQGIFSEGETKCTYGTGAFLLINTGHKIVYSSCGLLTTVCYKIREQDPPCYALEGSIGTAGAGVSWLKKNGFIKDPSETNEIMESTTDAGGVVFVPAFSGLYAPRWRTEARATIQGMTFNTERKHIVRALLEGIVFQLNEIIESLLSDAEMEMLPVLRCDGGMTKNKGFMQFNSDIINTHIEISAYSELTALGAAVLAGLGANIWKNVNEVKDIIRKYDKVYTCQMEKKVRKKKIAEWNDAVERILEHL